MEQLEVKHKAELSSFMRNEERELEQLRTTFEKDLDKLRQSHKTDLEKRVSCKTNHIILIDNCFFLVQTRSQREETKDLDIGEVAVLERTIIDEADL